MGWLCSVPWSPGNAASTPTAGREPQNRDPGWFTAPVQSVFKLHPHRTHLQLKYNRAGLPQEVQISEISQAWKGQITDNEEVLLGLLGNISSKCPARF